jgi:hypothetical protein
MVQQETVTRSITAVGEGLLESFNVETLGALFAVPDAAVEIDFYVGVVRKETDGLLVPAYPRQYLRGKGAGRRREVTSIYRCSSRIYVEPFEFLGHLQDE